MNLALSILANRSASFRLYVDVLDGLPVTELSSLYGLSQDAIRERVDAVRLSLRHQVKLDLNRFSKVFGSAQDNSGLAAA